MQGPGLQPRGIAGGNVRPNNSCRRIVSVGRNHDVRALIAGAYCVRLTIRQQSSGRGVIARRECLQGVGGEARICSIDVAASARPCVDRIVPIGQPVVDSGPVVAAAVRRHSTETRAYSHLVAIEKENIAVLVTGYDVVRSGDYDGATGSEVEVEVRIPIVGF